MRNRVLVWGLSNNRAGTEAVIYNYVSHLPNVSFDFLCYEAPENFHDLFDGTDNSYYVIPVKKKHPIANWCALRSFMKEHSNEYSAVWANLNDLSNIDILVQAKRCGIPRRITHIHSAGLPDVFVTKFFSKLNYRKCLRLTTDRWACSKAAGDALYGSMAYRIIPNAVDAKGHAFDAAKRDEVRTRWGIKDRFVIGTVGRLSKEKNHRLLIDSLPEILIRHPDAVLMLVGDGALHNDLEDQARQLGVNNSVLFVGSQKDVQAYLSAFDVFAFPSLYEGLSLSLLEAQFNGLPCVVSDGVSREAFISTNLRVVSLDDEPAWSSAISDARRLPDSLDVERAQRFTFDYIEEVAPTLF